LTFLSEEHISSLDVFIKYKSKISSISANQNLCLFQSALQFKESMNYFKHKNSQIN